MSLVPGDRLGSFEILGSLGAGGMGEVYRARDTRLQREVAVKVLPEAFARDHERLARFEREAQLLASLNHPNIAAIHGVEDAGGTRALILELVEGLTLSERIAVGPVPLDDALAIAREIAEALEAAHDQGIVHRDLKPANIKVTPAGSVKMLDFGLAKMLEAPARASALSMSPTLSVHTTYAGVILGTAAYMSPEQARGKPVDRRADIWAFGCVLFEMLTGTPAFDPGETVSDAVAGVLTREPEWSALPPHTPSHVRALLRRCLQKDPRKRLPHIGVARLDLQDVPDDGAAPRVADAKRPLLAWGVAALATIVALGFAGARFLRDAAAPVVTRTAILPPADQAFAIVTPATRFALSPDGRRLAFLATAKDGITRVWLRPLESMIAQPVGGTEGAVVAAWSPDSASLAFVANATLKRVDIGGGPPMTLSEPATNNGLAWGPNGILFSASPRSSISHIPADGGPVTQVTSLDQAASDTGHWMPWFLPDGRHFLFIALGGSGGTLDARAVYVHALGSSEAPRLVLQGGTNAKYANGYLLFLRGSTLMAQPFDLDRFELTGTPKPIAENVQSGGTSGRTGAVAVSTAGHLVYQTGAVSMDSRLTWFDRAGKPAGTLGDAADHFGVAISPDGTRVATSILNPGRRSRSIWVYDVARQLPTRVTFGATDDLSVSWSPDSRTIIYNSIREGLMNLVQKPANGGGADTTLLADRLEKIPGSWVPDGSAFLFFTRGISSARTAADVWQITMSGDRTARPVLQTEFNERAPAMSPDGRWLAYASDESGPVQVYVTSYPPTAGKWQVSRMGGAFPRWSASGRTLYFTTADNHLMAAEIDARADELRVGALTSLIEAPFRMATYVGLQAAPYDVAPDGRILVNLSPEVASDPLTLVTNWPQLLKE